MHVGMNVFLYVRALAVANHNYRVVIVALIALLHLLLVGHLHTYIYICTSICT